MIVSAKAFLNSLACVKNKVKNSYFQTGPHKWAAIMKKAI